MGFQCFETFVAGGMPSCWVNKSDTRRGAVAGIPTRLVIELCLNKTHSIVCRQARGFGLKKTTYISGFRSL